MTTRILSSLSCALALAFVASPLASQAQTPAPAPADAASTNAAPAPAAPAPAPADTNAASAERPSTYTIAQGDSLWTIAHKFGTTVVKLRKANNLKKGALLHPGQVLQIPPATTAK
jgi:5'-nucleotidase / UDP-sugar diphosphatase